jgi:pimeloyl-ACP methyl ester carboxylesterase
MMRAVEPAEAGIAEAPDGVRIAYEVFGAGEPTILFLPTTPIVHSRQWKAQVPFLSRRYRVVTYDGRGNGRSDRPADPAAYAEDRIASRGYRVHPSPGRGTGRCARPPQPAASA